MSHSKRPRVSSHATLSGEQRINKLLAAAGLGSRRQVDELIEQGRVEIDGKTISQVGIKVDADKVRITVDGEALKRHRPVYFAVNKPAGVLCTNRDPEGRPRVIDFVPGHHRLFPVGRLDAASTGLILLTNDGELAQRLAHPKHSVPKNYFVVVAGQVPPDAMRRLQRGIYLAEGLARVDGAKIRRVRKGCTEIDITLSEGKNREIRRVLARLGHRVVTLHRTAIGPLKLANLPEGASRPLTSEEVDKLYHAVEEIKREKKAARKLRDQQRREQTLEAVSQDGGLITDVEHIASPDSDLPVSELPKSQDKKRRTRETTEFKKRPSKKRSRELDVEDEADTVLDSLPSLSENPFAQEDDFDDFGQEELGNALLVKDHGPIGDAKVKPGKVLGYDLDSDEDLEALTSGGSVDEESDEPALESGSGEFNPWSQARPKRPVGRRTDSDRDSSRGRIRSRSGEGPSTSNRPRRSRSAGASPLESDSTKPRRGKYFDSKRESLGTSPVGDMPRTGESRSKRLRKPRKSDSRPSSSQGSSSANPRGSRRPSGDRSQSKKSRYGKGRPPRQR